MMARLNSSKCSILKQVHVQLLILLFINKFKKQADIIELNN